MHRRLWSKKTVYPKGTKFNYNFRADSPGRIGYLFGSRDKLSPVFEVVHDFIFGPPGMSDTSKFG